MIWRTRHRCDLKKYKSHSRLIRQLFTRSVRPSAMAGKKLISIERTNRGRKAASIVARFGTRREATASRDEFSLSPKVPRPPFSKFANGRTEAAAATLRRASPAPKSRPSRSVIFSRIFGARVTAGRRGKRRNTGRLAATGRSRPPGTP